MNPEAWEKYLEDTPKDIADSALENCSVQIEYHNTAIKAINSSYNNGDLGRGEFETGISQTEEEVETVRRQKVALESHKSEVRGGGFDSFRRATKADMAYLDLLICRYIDCIWKHCYREGPAGDLLRHSRDRGIYHYNRD
jgi:hypothetical protein